MLVAFFKVYSKKNSNQSEISIFLISIYYAKLIICVVFQILFIKNQILLFLFIITRNPLVHKNQYKLINYSKKHPLFQLIISFNEPNHLTLILILISHYCFLPFMLFFTKLILTSLNLQNGSLINLILHLKSLILRHILFQIKNFFFIYIY